MTARIPDQEAVDYILRWQSRQPEYVTLVNSDEICRLLGLSKRVTHRLIAQIRDSGTEIGILIIPKSVGSTYQYSEDDIARIQDYLFVRASKRDVMDLRRRTETP